MSAHIYPPGYVFPACGERAIRNFKSFPVSRWYEYHCLELHTSADAELWYHSHQRCEVLRPLTPNDSDSEMYRVRFADGFEADAFADEIFYRRSQFFRPDPPQPQKAAR